MSSPKENDREQEMTRMPKDNSPLSLQDSYFFRLFEGEGDVSIFSKSSGLEEKGIKLEWKKDIP